MLGWGLACVLAVAPVAEAASAGAQTEAETAEDEATIAGGWLAVVPLSFAWPSPAIAGDVEALNRAVRFGYRWGFDVGASFVPLARRSVPLWVNVTAGFDQTLWIFRNADAAGYELCFGGDCYGWDERGVGQIMRIGPVLRLGWFNRWALVWARASVQLAVGRVRLDCNNSVEDHCDRTETDLGPGLGGGLGAAWRITPVVAVGLEGKLDHAWLDRRDDPFAEVRSLDLALVFALRF